MVNYRYVFATAVIVFGSSFQFGYQTGVINAPEQLIKDFITAVFTSRSGAPTTAFVNAMSSLVVAAFPVGGIFGAVMGGSVSNKMGRSVKRRLSTVH